MRRDNEAWLADLGGNDASKDMALGDLRNALLGNLFRALSQRSIDPSFIEDAVQESLLRILDKLNQFEGRSHFLTWATAIAIRVAMGKLRRRHWQDRSLDEVLAQSSFLPKAAIQSPDTQVERRSIVGSMYAIIEEQLTEKQRTALLAELKGMPQDEIARQLGSNRNAIYKLTHDARKKLRKGLEAAGYSAEDVVATFSN